MLKGFVFMDGGMLAENFQKLSRVSDLKNASKIGWFEVV